MSTAAATGRVEEQEFTRGQRVTAFLVLLACFVIVGGSAFWVSYEHIRFLALLKHQPHHLAWVYPLTVDGMLGLGVSVAANVIWYVAVWGWDPVGVGVAAWPAAALLFSVEVVTNPSRRRKVLKATAKAAAEVEHMLRSAVTKPPTPSNGQQPAQATPSTDEQQPAPAPAAELETGTASEPIAATTAAEGESPVVEPVRACVGAVRRTTSRSMSNSSDWP